MRLLPRIAASASLLGILLMAGSTAAQLPTNNNPANQIRFSTPAKADTARQQLVNYIWSGGLPTSTLPIATSVAINSSLFDMAGRGTNLCSITQQDVAKVTRLDTNVMGMTMSSYLLTPATNTSHVHSLAIVQQGHYNELQSGNIAQTANGLLEAGYSVEVMEMPMMGWNVNFNVAQWQGNSETFTRREAKSLPCPAIPTRPCCWIATISLCSRTGPAFASFSTRWSRASTISSTSRRTPAR